MRVAEITDENTIRQANYAEAVAAKKTNPVPYIIVPRDITVRQYFPFLDSIIASFDTLLDYALTEHILVRANPRIIDTLAGSDYYLKMQQGVFIYDQRDFVALRKGDTLKIPDETEAAKIQNILENTVIDVNIPEYKLRILEYDKIKYTFPVRVGKNESKYLKLAKRTVSLRTPVGDGEIVRVERNPVFINPVTGERYTTTKRDDGKYTMMPQIPWLEPMIGGIRQGALIHPTTNPETLGKAYSNGCVGTGEGDAWIIYYHAPVSTKVKFRYDLDVENEMGERIRLKDIYQLKKERQHGATLMSETETDFVEIPLHYFLHHEEDGHECD